MKSNKNWTVDEFTKLPKEEQGEIIESLKEDLGGEEIDFKIYCPDVVKKWWDTKRAEEGKQGGLTSIQLLLSRFFLLILRAAFMSNAKTFDKKCTIAMAVFDNNVIIRDQGDTTHFGTGKEDEDTEKKTFH